MTLCNHASLSYKSRELSEPWKKTEHTYSSANLESTGLHQSPPSAIHTSTGILPQDPSRKMPLPNSLKGPPRANEELKTGQRTGKGQRSHCCCCCCCCQSLEEDWKDLSRPHPHPVSLCLTHLEPRKGWCWKDLEPAQTFNLHLMVLDFEEGFETTDFTPSKLRVCSLKASFDDSSTTLCTVGMTTQTQGLHVWSVWADEPSMQTDMT